MGYIDKIETSRKEKDQYMKRSGQSPLSRSLQEEFDRLEYYSVKEDYRFESIQLQKYDNPESVEMDTSDGRTRQYHKIGYFSFEVEGNTADIQVYQSKDNPEHYFVPFRDDTSGDETYGAGRYLDLDRNNDGTFDLDFNRAYNPFCAYSDAYSCPLPPMENWLDIPIKAGEKQFPLKDNI